MHDWAVTAALLWTPAASADANDEFIATIAQHGVLIINNRDVVEGVGLGQQVCQHTTRRLNSDG